MWSTANNTYIANSDPVSNMRGDRFATVQGKDDNSTMRYIEEIMKEQPKGETEGEEGGCENEE